jgi:hypothetical protein
LKAAKVLLDFAARDSYADQALTAADKDGLTPLHLAVIHSISSGIVQHILLHSTPHVKSYVSPITSLTYLSWAARMGRHAFITLVLELPAADVKALFWARDREQFLPFHHAVQVRGRSPCAQQNPKP